MHDSVPPKSSTVAQPVIAPVDPYICPDYARAEGEKLWPRVWQIACRGEEIPKVGDYVTYDIMDESIIVVRLREGSGPDAIRAYYNVCLHRGRRLTKGCGHTNQFYCRFHGWSWNLDGENRSVLDREDWGEALTCENLRMQQVRVDAWGGWVWINMDPNAEPLLDYLGPVASRLDPFGLDRMRYRWRQWLHFPCNWKVAIGAFIESYHLAASHPQNMRGASSRRFWSRTLGRHAQQGGIDQRGDKGTMTSGLARADRDPRVAIAEDQAMTWETLNALTTETFLNASERLADELPPGLSLQQVAGHLFAAARRDDAARGVIWPDLDPAYLSENAVIWHLFPNTVIINSITCALCYRARPNGDDPNRCIFEVYTIERFPEGQEPRTEWVHKPEPTEENWRLILAQDFQNMSEVQKGMKSRGFPGARPNPVEELPVAHFLRNLADYMGTGAPQPIAAR